MHAQIENMLTCSHWSKCVQPEEGLRLMPDGETELGFCGYHLEKLDSHELEWWTDSFMQKLRALEEAEKISDSLVNEESEAETNAELEALLDGEVTVDDPEDDGDDPIDFSALDLD